LDFKRIGAPEVERDQRQLEGNSDERHRDPQQGDDDRWVGEREGLAFHDQSEPLGEQREVGRAQEAAEKAEAVEHDAGGSGSVDDVLEGGLARLPAALEEADHRVAGDADHFDREEGHQQVIGAGGHEHADARSDHQGVEVGAVFLIGDAGEDGQRHRENEEEHEAEAEEDREGVVHHEAGEIGPGGSDAGLGQLKHGIQELQSADAATGPQVSELREDGEEGGECAEQGDPAGRNRPIEVEQSRQQQEDDRDRQDQLRHEDLQRPPEVALELIEELGDGHGVGDVKRR
jgi:hypothetical protein